MKRLLQLMMILFFAFALASGCGSEDSGDDSSADVGVGDVDLFPDASEAGLSLESIYPVSGTSQGGQQASLYGTGFAEGATVSFGDVEAETTFVSTTQLDTTTPGGEPGPVDVSVENPDGETSILEDGFEYVVGGEGSLEVGWCNLHYPASTMTSVDSETEAIYGRIYVENCTEGGGDCPQIEAELGWGATDVDPSADAGSWEWIEAERNMGFEEENDHEYQASITPDAEGDFAYVYRFAVDGSEWTYCDLTGLDEGFDTAEMGELTVGDEPVEPVDPLEIGWCNLEYPESTTTDVDTETEAIYGQVYVENCTEGGGDCPEIEAELGWGATDVDPSSDAGSWEWIEAERNMGFEEENDHEYQASITPDAEGDFAYVYRFAVDGSDWAYCDLTGLDDGFDTAQMGELTVGEEPVEPVDPLEIGWCNLEHPESTTTDVDTETEAIYGRVYVEGCTDEDGDCSEVEAELGWGATDVDPSSDAGSWDWIVADQNTGFDGGNNHEYQASITPDTEGDFAYVYRFAVDGSDWAYCDLTGLDDGFDTAQMGELTVEDDEPTDTVEIGWCNLQHPESTTTSVDAETEAIYGRVYVEDCTGEGMHCEQVVGQVGYGPDDGDPSADPGAYQWEDADYNPDYPDSGSSNNDEHMTTLTPTTEGTFTYVFRFSGDGGTNWSYCDLTGSDDGFDPAEMGTLNVDP